VLVFFCVLILILALFLINLRVRVWVKIDVLKNSGAVSVQLFGLYVFKTNFWSDANPTNIKFASKKKSKSASELHLSADVKDKQSVAAMIRNPLFANVRIPAMDVQLHMGVSGDAFLTVMGFGTARIILHGVFAYMRNRFNTDITQNLTPCFDQNRLDVEVQTEVHISAGDLVVGLFVLITHKIKAGIHARKQKAKYKKARRVFKGEQQKCI